MISGAITRTIALAIAITLPGCAVISVASTAVSVGATAVGAGVSAATTVAKGTVRVTSAVVDKVTD